MEVILLERVAKLGQMGEVVRVKDGFAHLAELGDALQQNDFHIRFSFRGLRLVVDVKTRNQDVGSGGGLPCR